MRDKNYDYYGTGIFVDRENSLLGYTRPFVVSNDIETPIEEYKSKKKQETMKEIEARIHQYTYTV